MRIEILDQAVQDLMEGFHFDETQRAGPSRLHILTFTIIFHPFEVRKDDR